MIILENAMLVLIMTLVAFCWLVTLSCTAAVIYSPFAERKLMAKRSETWASQHEELEIGLAATDLYLAELRAKLIV